MAENPLKKYIVEGYELVLDAFDDSESENRMPPLTVMAASLEEAIREGDRLMQEEITEYRRKGGFMSSGSFSSRVDRVKDDNGNVLYQK